MHALAVNAWENATIWGVRIVARYSQTYIDGDEHEGRFHRWLALTLGSFLTLIVAGNVWGFWVLWVATSLCLHELLAFYRDRPGAECHPLQHRDSLPLWEA